MKLAVSLAFAAAAILAACSPAPVREPSAAAGGDAGGCSTQGASVCRAGTLYRCEGGAWNSTFNAC